MSDVQQVAQVGARGVTLWHFAGIVGALTGVHVVWGLLRGSLVLSPNGVLLGPMLLGAGAWLALGSAQALRAGRALEGALPLALLVALSGFLASGWLARRMIFPGDPTPLPRAGPVRPGVEVVEYDTDDGLTLRGLLVRAHGGPASPGGEAGATPPAPDRPQEAPSARPTLLYFHGNGEAAVANLDTAGLFAAQGLDVVVAEYRGYGGCPGSPSEEGLLRDARAAVALACARTGARPEDLVLFGRSLGSGVAAALAAEGVGRAVVLLSPYTSILDLAADLVPRPLARLALRDTFRSRERLLAATQPVVVLHGTRDPVIPFAHGEALAAALGQRATLVRLEGAGHNDVFAREAARIVEVTLKVAAPGR